MRFSTKNNGWGRTILKWTLLVIVGMAGIVLPQQLRATVTEPENVAAPTIAAESSGLAAPTIAQVPAGAHSQVSIRVDGVYRYITANGIPDHDVGTFPNNRNPNAIEVQEYTYRVPTNPTVAEAFTAFTLGTFGIGVNGVLFEPGAAEFWRGDRNSGWQYEALNGVLDLGLDRNHAHVQPGGVYHYHGSPTGLIEDLGVPHQMLLLGYAADGFPIYSDLGYNDPNDSSSGVRTLKSSYRLKTGQRPSGIDGPGGTYDGSFVQDYEYVWGLGDLDKANGRYGVASEYPEGTYYYVITEGFPFIPRMFRGMPDPSFRIRSDDPQGASPPRPAGNQPPRVPSPGTSDRERPPGLPPGRPPGSRFPGPPPPQ